MQVFNEAGVPVYRVGVSPMGGSVVVRGNDGNKCALLYVDPDTNRGSLSIHSNDGDKRVVVDVQSECGNVWVFGNDGETCAIMGLWPNFHSGSVRDFERNLVATMDPSLQGGLVETYGHNSGITGRLP